MPTYEYECIDCGQVMEIFHSITLKPKRKAFCEKCGEQRSVRRLIGTGGGLIFKGSGFYETDYRSASYKKAEKAEKEAAKGKKDSDGKKKDGKKTGASKSDGSKKTTKPGESSQ